MLQLPVDRRRSAAQTYERAQEPVRLSSELVEAVKRVSVEEGTTVFITFLAALKTLLYRYTGQVNIVVEAGMMDCAGNTIETPEGLAVGTVTICAGCQDNISFRNLVSRVHQAAVEAFKDHETRLEIGSDELQPEYAASHAPLFLVMFNLQNETAPAPDFGRQKPNLKQAEERAGNCDLALSLRESEGGIAGALEYDKTLFDQTTVRRLVSHYQSLLEGATSRPDQQLIDLPLLSAAERFLILEQSKGALTEYPRWMCAHELFQDQAERTPDQVAVACSERQLSYAELDRRSNQVAAHLRELGIGPGSLVGVCLRHSLEELVALLGALKSGAGYVPLDPDHPEHRRTFVLTDAQVKVVLTENLLSEEIKRSGVRVISLDGDWRVIAQQSDTKTNTRVSAQNIAYVIYTSGSTGEPKGVAIDHQALVNYIWWAKKVYLRNERLGFPLYSSAAFDLTVTSIYAPLISGTTVMTYQQQMAKEWTLSHILADPRVGVLKLTPSHLLLLKELNSGQSGVRRLIVGGEALSSQLAQEVTENFGNQVEIYNEYGPTEATVGCMIHRYDPAHDKRPFVPIGRSADNACIYILDGRMNPTPDNVVGELYIGGDGLAQGYWNQPGLTAEKFLPNPFVTADSRRDRLYRTGDVAKRLPDGNIEFLGRRDEQVKFHGYRIEMNEIRAAMNRHPEVRDSMALIKRNETGTDVMVVYYVARQEIGAERLRSFLEQFIIREILPNFFVHLKRIPLTLNGKVNYNALPPPQWNREEGAAARVAPRNVIEQTLAEIWDEVLGVPESEIGIYDSFFTLGGHSLQALRMITRIRERLSVEMPLSGVYLSLNLSKLAEAVAEQQMNAIGHNTVYELLDRIVGMQSGERQT